MTTIYGDGYEAATEPGPDVELRGCALNWVPRECESTPLSPCNLYRRPIKLRVGEMYGCRNGAIVMVVDIRDGKVRYPYLSTIVTDERGVRRENDFMSYKENGDFYEFKSPWDIIEHIPKQPTEKPMKEQTITVNNVTLTHAQVQEAYDKMVKAKAENEVNVGDWVVHKDGFILKVVGISGINISTKGWSYSKNYCEKLHLTPEKKAWLDSLIGGVE